MNAEHRQILNMLAEGKITPDEAERLMEAVGKPAAEKPEAEACCGGKTPKFLCVKVEPKAGGKDRVDIRIPLMLIKAGVKLGSMLPGDATDKIKASLGEKGIDLDLKNMDKTDINQFIAALTENHIDVESDKESVRIYCC